MGITNIVHMEDCTCGKKPRHVLHCARCKDPIDQNRHGFTSQDGDIHVGCGTQEEFDYYMATPYQTNAAIVAYMKEKFNGPSSL